MPRVVFIIALGVGAACGALVQPPPFAAAAADPNKVTSEECDEWRQALSLGRKLSELPDDAYHRFNLCIDPGGIGSSKSIELSVPKSPL
jgi:hypothetical protein